MKPEVMFFHHPVAMYGVMILLGLILGTALAVYLSSETEISGEDVVYAVCYGVIGMTVGGKFLYLLVSLPQIVDICRSGMETSILVNMLLTGGFVFYGGLFGALGGFFIYCKIYRISFQKLLTVVIPAVPLVHGIGRVGCFFAGCCYGRQYTGFLHIIFRATPFAPCGIPLFPVQLMEAAANFVLFLWLLFRFRNNQRERLFCEYLAGYGGIRFVAEFFRGDVRRGMIGVLSVSQILSVLVVAGVLVYSIYKRKKEIAER